jgi:hypothetical protein
MNIPEMSTQLYYPNLKSLDGLPTYSVAWLGNSVPREGELNDKVLELLREFAATNTKTKVFGFECGAWGSHTCEICHQFDQHGEIVVSTCKAHYLIPKMIFHYVEAHRYMPPEEFISELLSSQIEQGAPPNSLGLGSLP